MDSTNKERSNHTKDKRVFYTEAAYIIGLAALALGTAFMTVADFGVSMIVAPAYLVHLKLSEVWSFVTFGVAEYILQFLLLVLMVAVVKQFKVSYLFSFATAVFYGLMLDGFLWILDFGVTGGVITGIPARIICYAIGMLFCTAGVSLMFHTYISPEVYELFVKEVADKYHLSLAKVKTGYDCSSLLLAIVLSFLFYGFGTFVGVNVGTVICALMNGWMIGQFTHFFEKHWEFKNGLNVKGK